MFLKNKITSIALITASFFAGNTSAHDAWVHPTKGPVYPVYYGHRVYELFPITKITSLDAYSTDHRKLACEKMQDADGVSVKVSKGKPAMFCLAFDNGYWVKGAAEGGGTSHMNVGRGQLDQGTNPSHPLKFSKTILSWEPWMQQPIGQRVELVPVAFTSTPQGGSTLKLRLLYEGKPLAGQKVENNSSEEGPKTDADGYVTVEVEKGMNRFASDYTLPKSEDPKAERMSLTAALVFMVE
jgi:nickel transport protein